MKPVTNCSQLACTCASVLLTAPYCLHWRATWCAQQNTGSQSSRRQLGVALQPFEPIFHVYKREHGLLVEQVVRRLDLKAGERPGEHSHDRDLGRLVPQRLAALRAGYPVEALAALLRAEVVRPQLVLAGLDAQRVLSEDCRIDAGRRVVEPACADSAQQVHTAVESVPVAHTCTPCSDSIPGQRAGLPGTS